MKPFTRLVRAAAFMVAIAGIQPIHAAEPTQNEVVALPISGLALASRNGKLRLVSDNGRFIIEGKVYDTWHKEFIETLDQARYTMNHINLSKLNLNVDELAPVTYGTGPKTVTIFVDPYCPWCKRMLDEMKGLEKEYTFKVLAVPVLGDRSTTAVRALHCSSDQQRAKGILLEGSGFDALSPDNGCDTEPLSKRVITTQLFGIRGVPYVIRHDGLIQQGYTKLAPWLKIEGA